MKDKIKNILDITFWKFVLVGIVNTLVGTGVMFAAYNLLHLSYWLSSASNYVVGSVVSYFLNKYFEMPQSSQDVLCGIFIFTASITFVICFAVFLFFERKHRYVIRKNDRTRKPQLCYKAAF